MHRNELQEHIFSTYITLRFGLAVVAGLLPIVVYIAGRLDDVPLQDSLSAYYWATGTGDYVARVWFVGGIFAIASGLYLYKGFTVSENIALNLAAIFGLGVAAFPMEWNCGTSCGKFSIHGFSAIAMFACLVYVVWFRGKDTLKYLPGGEQGARARKYRRLYRLTAAVMALTPLTAFVLISVVNKQSAFVFFVESAAVMAFALYWWIKSTELRTSGAVREALQREMETPA